MKTLQTGTKVLIEATVEMTDGKDDTTLVRFKTSGCYWMDTSDLTVCETEEEKPVKWKVHRSDPDFEKVGEAAKFPTNQWRKEAAWIVTWHIPEDPPFAWTELEDCREPQYSYPTITGQQALKLLGVPELQKQHPGVFEPPQNDEWRPNNGESKVEWTKQTEWVPEPQQIEVGDVVRTERFNETWFTELMKPLVGREGVVTNIVCDGIHVLHHGETLTFMWPLSSCTLIRKGSTPSFKAGQEVEFNPDFGDKIHALKVSEWVDAIYCCPHPNQTSALKHIVTDVDSIITWSTSAIRPIPAQPTVLDELCRFMQKYGQHDDDISELLNIFDRHQKHSGRLKVTNSDDGDIDYSLKSGESVWFSFKSNPTEKEDWLQAKIIDLNWAYRAAAIQLEGYKDATCCGIASLKRSPSLHDQKGGRQ